MAKKFWGCFEFESEHSWAIEHGDCRQCNAACTSSSNKQNCKLCIQSNGFTHKKGRRHCTTMVLVVGYIYSRMCVKEALYYMCVHLGNLANNKESSENSSQNLIDKFHSPAKNTIFLVCLWFEPFLFRVSQGFLRWRVQTFSELLRPRGISVVELFTAYDFNINANFVINTYSYFAKNSNSYMYLTLFFLLSKNLFG